MVGNKRGQHAHFALGKVYHIRRLVDNGDGDAEKTVAGSDGQSFNQQHLKHAKTPFWPFKTARSSNIF